jgi:glc operon protein GlcG
MKIALCILLARSLASTVLGAPLTVDRPTITTEAAEELIAKAEAKARSLHRTVEIAVVDSGGNLLAFERMDGCTFLAGIDLCMGTARSAE